MTARPDDMLPFRARRRLGARALVLLVGLACLVSVRAPAQAQQAQTQAQTPAESADASSTIIVFDGSGSMRAPLEGTRVPKLGLAREGIQRALARLPRAARVGLASFGHRRGDCADIEVLRAPEPVDAQRLDGLIEKLNPRGRGPIAQSLRVAAKALAPAGQRSLVLIHDDADNCAVDLCAAAAELAKQKIVVHAIGLALKPEDRPKMACLPQLTGGRFYNATTPEQVGAAIDDALKLAANVPLAEPTRPARPLEGLEALATVPDTAPAGLYLRAQLVPGGAVAMRAVHWTVLPDAEGAVALLDARRANPYLALAPGAYTVLVRDGAASARATVTVAKDKPTQLVVPLQAGNLAVRVLLPRGATPVGDALVTIARVPAGVDATTGPLGDVVATLRGTGPVLLPAGQYIVRADLGAATAQGPAVVEAGQDRTLDLTLDAARLQLAAANAALAPATFAVFEDDPDAPRGRRELLRSAERQPEFVLRPGSYVVELRQENAIARERVTLGAGETVTRTLTVAAAQVQLISRLGQAPLSERIVYQIERLDGGASAAVTTSRAAPTLLLGAGRYRIESRFGTMNARTAREIEVKAGAPVQQVIFDHQAGTLRLKAANAPGEVFWDVLDAAGAPVWSTGAAEPELVLQAGRYSVRAQARDRQVARGFELKGGEQRSLELAFE